jgi:hypothetical protein
MNSLKAFLICVGMSLASACFSQNLQQEINEQVWNVQLEAMRTNQPDLFMSVMSKDVVQISYDRQVIREYASFREQALKTYARLTERKMKRQMEFRFVKRAATTNQAYEHGFFQYELTNDKNEISTFYGAFQVVLRKESGTWKVLVDYDAETYGGVPVTAEMFKNAKTMTEL